MAAGLGSPRMLQLRCSVPAPPTEQSCPSKLRSGEGKCPALLQEGITPPMMLGVGQEGQRVSHQLPQPPRMAPESQGQGQPPTIATQPCHSCPGTSTAPGTRLRAAHSRPVPWGRGGERTRHEFKQDENHPLEIKRISGIITETEEVIWKWQSSTWPSPGAVGWLQVQGQCGWTGTGPSLHLRHTTAVPTLYLSRHRVKGPFHSMDNTPVPEQFVLLPFSNLHFCTYNSQQHWGSCSLSTPRIKTKSGTFLCSQSNEEP